MQEISHCSAKGRQRSRVHISISQIEMTILYMGLINNSHDFNGSHLPIYKTSFIRGGLKRLHRGLYAILWFFRVPALPQRADDLGDREGIRVVANKTKQEDSIWPQVFLGEFLRLLLIARAL